jgi:predicted alpha/beta-fold hydrolase
MRDFDPLVRNPHLQTILGHFWPRRLDTRRFPVEQRLIRTGPDTLVLVQTQHPRGESRGDVVLVHGLEGSGEAGYMTGMCQAGLQAGLTMHRFHLRTCGGTEHLCTTLYHSGLTGDLLAFLRQLGRPAHLVGFSLGGNVVLKLAGELCDEGPALLRGVCGASTPIDLAASCRAIAGFQNRIYERRFVRRMRRRLTATGRYSRRDFDGLRSILDIDEHITAPAFGFRGAEHYYATQSSMHFLELIRVPALLVHAQDDPLVPFAAYSHPAIGANPRIRLLAPAHGGHLGFLSRRAPRFWLDGTVLEWVFDSQGTNGGVTP